jgi:hypothetical protein
MIKIAKIDNIIQFTIIDFVTQIKEKSISEVTTLHIKDQTVEKNNNFQITTAFFS